MKGIGFTSISVLASFVLIATGVVAVSATPVVAQTLTCLQLTVDLKSGAVDKVADGDIRALQRFLVQEGYLTASPNGRLGPATTAAVKKFQMTNGLPSTGTVGPLTRAAIQKKTCNTSVSVTTQQPSTVATSSGGSTETVISRPGNVDIPSAAIADAVNRPSISIPRAGDEMTIGTSQNITWENPSGNTYDLYLEKNDRASGGFVSTGLRTAGTFSWRVGKVIVSSNENLQTVATGTYRIRVQRISGAQDTDPTSGWFTIKAPPLVINSVTPAVAVADDNASISIVGSNFSGRSTVYIDSYGGTTAHIQYISPDGTIMVVTIPKQVTAGTHSIFVYNFDGTSSNKVNVRILQP